MLPLFVPANEYFDEENEEFITFPGQHLQLEHSLVSISKWESKWHKPFLGKEKMTLEETIDYIRCMTLTQKVNELTYKFLTNENINDVNKYIEDPMTATWFSEEQTEGKGKINGEIVTSELIYYWMVALQIPVEFQKWHLNRLLTLIRVCNIKNAPQKKMSKKEIMSRNRALNEARKKKYNTKG